MLVPERPALADVLPVFVNGEREEFSAWLAENAPSTLSVEPTPTGKLGLYELWGESLKVGAGRGFLMAAKDITVEEAWEALQAREVTPPHDERRGFAAVVSVGSLPRTEWHFATPQSIADLVAWASLGAPAILRAEELAREVSLRLGSWGVAKTERVVWRFAARGKASAPVWWPLSGRYQGLVTLFANGDLGQNMGWLGKMVSELGPAVDLWSAGLKVAGLQNGAVIIACPPLGAE